MKKWLLIFFVVAAFVARAQDQGELKLINAQVWDPYVKAYNDYRTKEFMKLHTDDVVRISRSGGLIMVGNEYRKSQFRSNSIALSRDIERTLELRFLDRLVHHEIAYEVGYYKLMVSRPDGRGSTIYGRFHAILKKLDGEWKIYIGSDEQLPELSEEEFLAAKSLCDF